MRVRHVLRHRPLFALLGCLAILGQLLLPTLHAQTWARQNGDPLLLAICGKLSPALLREMRRVTPAELVQKLQQDHAAQSAADCPLCLSVHAGLAVGGSAVATAANAGGAATPVVTPAADIVAAPQLRLPPSRGPPALSQLIA